MTGLLFYLIGVIISFIVSRYLIRRQVKKENREYKWGDAGYVWIYAILSWWSLIWLYSFTLLFYLIDNRSKIFSNIPKNPPKWM